MSRRYKRIGIPEDCVGTVVTAIRIRIIYLQSYREQSQREGYPQAAEAIMKDIANLTMIMDNINENPMEL